MKFFYCLLFTCLIITSLHAQNCKILENQSFFKSIQFGKPFPSQLSNCLTRHIFQYSSNTDYFLEFGSLSRRCNKKYADLFSFLSTPFNFLKITTNKRGQIFYVSLRTFFDDNRNDSSIYEPPRNYTRIYNKLVSLYGKPTSTEFANHDDSLFVKQIAMPRMAEWLCNGIYLQLSVRYGASDKNLNFLMVEITNRQFIFIQELMKAE